MLMKLDALHWKGGDVEHKHWRRTYEPNGLYVSCEIPCTSTSCSHAFHFFSRSSFLWLNLLVWLP